MRLVIGLTLVAFGIMLLGWSLYATINPVAHYDLRRMAASAEAVHEAGSLSLKGAALERFEVSAHGETRGVAEGLVARDADNRLAPVVWRNNVTEPVFFADIAASDLGKLLAAIREHVAEDAVILSWWDLSRAIRLATGRNAPLDDARARGLLVPPAWKNTSAQETARWGAGVDAATTQRFGEFIDALLLNEDKGADALEALAGGKPAFIALHIADVWKIAAARPEKIAIAYKDFPAATVDHGLIKSAQQWLREEKIDGAFAVEPTGGATRLHYLPRKPDSDALIVRLLPFSTSLPEPPKRLSLVWQHKGWWVWRLND